MTDNATVRHLKNSRNLNPCLVKLTINNYKTSIFFHVIYYSLPCD